VPTLEIQERVVIKAPVDRVWKFLLDPARVVACLPGATFDGAESDQVFLEDRNGAGTARLEMTGRVVEVDGGAELTVDAGVDLTGKIVTFGRGLMKSVSAQLFKEFAARAQAALEPAAATEPTALAEPLRALPLLFRALASSIAGLFRRLFRRKRTA